MIPDPWVPCPTRNQRHLHHGCACDVGSGGGDASRVPRHQAFAAGREVTVCSYAIRTVCITTSTTRRRRPKLKSGLKIERDLSLLVSDPTDQARTPCRKNLVFRSLICMNILKFLKRHHRGCHGPDRLVAQAVLAGRAADPTKQNSLTCDAGRDALWTGTKVLGPRTTGRPPWCLADPELQNVTSSSRPEFAATSSGRGTFRM